MVARFFDGIVNRGNGSRRRGRRAKEKRVFGEHVHFLLFLSFSA
jgi:hypothetical protein